MKNVLLIFVTLAVPVLAKELKIKNLMEPFEQNSAISAIANLAEDSNDLEIAYLSVRNNGLEGRPRSSVYRKAPQDPSHHLIDGILENANLRIWDSIEGGVLLLSSQHIGIGRSEYLFAVNASGKFSLQHLIDPGTVLQDARIIGINQNVIFVAIVERSVSSDSATLKTLELNIAGSSEIRDSKDVSEGQVFLYKTPRGLRVIQALDNGDSRITSCDRLSGRSILVSDFHPLTCCEDLVNSGQSVIGYRKCMPNAICMLNSLTFNNVEFRCFFDSTKEVGSSTDFVGGALLDNDTFVAAFIEDNMTIGFRSLIVDSGRDQKLARKFTVPIHSAQRIHFLKYKNEVCFFKQLDGYALPPFR